MGFDYDYSKLYFAIAALIFELLLAFFVFTKYYADDQGRRFRLLVMVGIVATIFESIRPPIGALPYTPTIHYIKKIVQSICYITATGISFSFTRYIDSFLKTNLKARKTLRTINYSIYIAYSLLLIANIWTEWIGSYDEQARKWTYGPIYLAVGYGTPIFFILSTLILFFKDLNRMEWRVRLTLIAAIFISIGAIIAQPFFHGGVRVTSFGVALSLYLCYFSLENYDYRRLIEANDKLRKAEKKALSANEAKSTFLANMSHEIRTPMNAVLGLDEMILRTDDKAEINEYARNIQSAGKTLLAIINDILDFSKIESGRMQIVEAPYHLAELLDDVCKMIGMRASQKKLIFTTDIEESLHEELFGDEVRVRQIIINVLNNAVKYTETGSVSLTVSGKLLPDANAVQLSIVVKDSGIGIKEENLASLFVSFERIEENYTHNTEGTGLGLAIVYNLLKLMGGEILVDSTFGKGSTFTILLPQKLTGPATISSYRAAKTQSKATPKNFLTERFVAPKARILLVDDNSINLLVAKGLLKYTKAHIVTCQSGAECLKLMKEQKFDIIFLDHMMPEMDGIETLKASRALVGNLNTSTPIIALTANAMAGMREHYIGLGFSDYLSKPIDSNQLYELLYRTIPSDLLEQADEVKEEGQKPKTEQKDIAPSVQPNLKTHKSEVQQKPSEEESTKMESTTLNKEAALALCNGDTNMYRQLLEVFCEEKSKNLSAIITSLIAEDWRTYTVHVHGLKSTSRLIGATKLSDLASKLEASGNKLQADPNDKTQADYINSEQGNLVALYDEAIEAASAELG